MSEPDRNAALIPAVRLLRIQEMLDERGSLTLREGQQELNVSEMTVRRDFANLEKLGVVERTWGGIVAKRPLMSERAHTERVRTESEAKQTIAALAETCIEEGDTVFLSGGTTSLALPAKLLAERTHLTIITTSLPALMQLVGKPELVVIAIGGRTSPYNNDMTGPQAQAALADYRADKAVIGATGVSADGVFNANLERAAIDRLMVKNANETLVVSDHTKLGLSALALVTPLLPTMTLVTDQALPPHTFDWFDAAGVRLVGPAASDRVRTDGRASRGRAARSTSRPPSTSPKSSNTKEN